MYSAADRGCPEQIRIDLHSIVFNNIPGFYGIQNSKSKLQKKI